MVSLSDIQEAQKAIAPFITCTPLVHSVYLSRLCCGQVFLKLENQQITNAFKVRGAFYKLLHLTQREKDLGIITASAGNHGQAVAYAAKKLGFPRKNRCAHQLRRTSRLTGYANGAQTSSCSATATMKQKPTPRSLRKKMVALTSRRTTING